MSLHAPLHDPFSSVLPRDEGDVGRPDPVRLNDRDAHARVQDLRDQLRASDRQRATFQLHERSLRSELEWFERDQRLPHVVCRAECECRARIASGEASLPELSRDQLIAWLQVFRGNDPDIAPGTVLRPYLYGAAGTPENELNVRRVGLARRFAAFGLTPDYYGRLKHMVRALPAQLLVEVLGGKAQADEYGLLIIPASPAAAERLVWRPFCPLIWREGAEAPAAVSTIIARLRE